MRIVYQWGREVVTIKEISDFVHDWWTLNAYECEDKKYTEPKQRPELRSTCKLKAIHTLGSVTFGPN